MVGKGEKILPERKTWHSQDGNSRPRDKPIVFAGLPASASWLALAAFWAWPADLLGLREKGTGGPALPDKVAGPPNPNLGCAVTGGPPFRAELDPNLQVGLNWPCVVTYSPQRAGVGGQALCPEAWVGGPGTLSSSF